MHQLSGGKTLTRWLPILLLFLAWPAWAADENLDPNDVESTTNGYAGGPSGPDDYCSSVTCESYIDEYSGEDDVIVVSPYASLGPFEIMFPTPSSSPSTGTDEQTINIIASCLRVFGSVKIAMVAQPLTYGSHVMDLRQQNLSMIWPPVWTNL